MYPSVASNLTSILTADTTTEAITVGCACGTAPITPARVGSILAEWELTPNCPICAQTLTLRIELRRGGWWSSLRVTRAARWYIERESHAIRWGGSWCDTRDEILLDLALLRGCFARDDVRFVIPAADNTAERTAEVRALLNHFRESYDPAS